MNVHIPKGWIMKKGKLVLVAITLLLVIVLVSVSCIRKQEGNEDCDQVVMEVKEVHNESEEEMMVKLEIEIYEERNPEYIMWLSMNALEQLVEGYI